MSENNRRYVFIMFGFPGSGKSFVSKWLAAKFNAVHLKVDNLRFAMFDGDRPDLYTPANKALVNNAVSYVYGQIVKTRTASIILDGNFNQRNTRMDIEKTASKYDALPIVVWVKTPEATAEQRIKTRAETEGHVIFDPNIIQNMLKRMQLPDEREHLIVVDGLQSADAQQESFEKQLVLLNPQKH
jgi:predicted kinase